MGKDVKFGQKSKFWSDVKKLVGILVKIEILGTNRNFGKKLKFWSEIEILVKRRKNVMFTKNIDFGKKKHPKSCIKPNPQHIFSSYSERP